MSFYNFNFSQSHDNEKLNGSQILVRILLGLVLVLLLTLTGTAQAADEESALTNSASQDGVEEVVDPFGRQTPRSTVQGFIKALAPINIGFMGGGGDQRKFTEETGPEIAQKLKEAGVDAVLLTAG